MILDLKLEIGEELMRVIDIIKSRRTKRKFLQKKVPTELLTELVECARFAPTGANLQPLKYVIIDEEELVLKIFGFTKWSGYHPEDGPTTEEMPPSYIAIFGDKNIKSNREFQIDAGAAGTVIQLAAEELGLSSCWLGAIDRKNISDILKASENLELLYLIAIGYSDQKGRTVLRNDDIKYYTDENGVLTVPKRGLDEIIIHL